MTPPGRFDANFELQTLAGTGTNRCLVLRGAVMSKIFDAYKKQTALSDDLESAVGRVGSVTLFPAPRGRQVDDFTQLANQILGLHEGRRGVVLAMASSAPGEGASYVSYNAACVLAQSYGRRVCWIDANFLTPQAKLRGAPSIGFADLIADPGRVSQVDNAVNPALLPGGADVARARSLLASGGLSTALDHLRSRFDFVIVDLAPMLASSDTALVAAEADGFLLVIEQQNLKWEVIQHGLDAMRDKGVQALGAVINRREFVLPKVVYDRL